METGRNFQEYFNVVLTHLLAPVLIYMIQVSYLSEVLYNFKSNYFSMALLGLPVYIKYNKIMKFGLQSVRSIK